MDTVVVIIVLITLLVLFGGAGWFFVRETGVENAKLWLTSPRQMRQVVTPFRQGNAEGQETATLDAATTGHRPDARFRRPPDADGRRGYRRQGPAGDPEQDG